MEELVCSDIAFLPQLSPHRRRLLFAWDKRGGDGHKYELTKSAINLLHNIVNTDSIPADTNTRQVLDRNESTVWLLLSPTKPLAYKHSLLENKPDVLLALAKTCLLLQEDQL
jgi:hypothetical protein